MFQAMVKLRTNWCEIISWDYSDWLWLLKNDVFYIFFQEKKKKSLRCSPSQVNAKLKCSQTIITYRWQWPILNWLKISLFQNKCLMTNIWELIKHFPLLNVKIYRRMDAIWWPFDTIKLDSPQFSPQAYRVVIADVEKKLHYSLLIGWSESIWHTVYKEPFLFFLSFLKESRTFIFLIAVQLVDSKAIHSFSEIVVIEFDTFLRKHESIVVVTRKKNSKVCVIQSGSGKRS